VPDPEPEGSLYSLDWSGIDQESIVRRRGDAQSIVGPANPPNGLEVGHEIVSGEFVLRDAVKGLCGYGPVSCRVRLARLPHCAALSFQMLVHQWPKLPSRLDPRSRVISRRSSHSRPTDPLERAVSPGHSVLCIFRNEGATGSNPVSSADFALYSLTKFGV